MRAGHARSCNETDCRNPSGYGENTKCAKARAANARDESTPETAQSELRYSSNTWEKKMKRLFMLIGVALALVSGFAIGHGGGLDSSGCHHDNKNGGYHCHR